jgi:hypothetical protein
MEIHVDTLIKRVEGYCNLDSEWHPDDSLELFLENKDRVSAYYKSGPTIHYKCNSLGYRCDELESYKKRNFILVFGCSYTEGVSLHEKDVWHSIIGKELGLPVMNLGMAGIGPDLVALNTIQYFKTKLPKPKHVIYQWPSPLRKSFAYDEKYFHCLLPDQYDDHIYEAHKRDSTWYATRFLTRREHAHWDFYQYVNMCDALWKNDGITPIHWALDTDIIDPENITKIRDQIIMAQTTMIDKGRDCSHPGRECHKELVTHLKEHDDVQKIYNMA